MRMGAGGDLHFDVDVVARNDLLPADGDNLDLHVDDAHVLRAEVDLHQTGVDRLVKLAEPRDEPNGTWTGYDQ